MIEDFSICHLCQRHRWGTLSWEYLRKFAKKFETSLMVYSGAWGKLIPEKPEVKNLVTLSLQRCPLSKCEIF